MIDSGYTTTGKRGRPKMETAERFYQSEVERFIQELREVESLSKQSDEMMPELFAKLLSAEKQMADSLHEIEDRLGGNPRLIENAKIQFRRNIRPWYDQSLLMKRATEKPLGYPGDYVLLEAIYENTPLSKGFGRYLDHLLLNDKLAIAVRNRKDKIRTWLKAQFDLIEDPKKEFKILNIASGSCREWHGLLSQVDSGEIKLTCIDFDQRALDFAKKPPGRPVYPGQHGIPAGQCASYGCETKQPGSFRRPGRDLQFWPV